MRWFTAMTRWSLTRLTATGKGLAQLLLRGLGRLEHPVHRRRELAELAGRRGVDPRADRARARDLERARAQPVHARDEPQAEDPGRDHADAGAEEAEPHERHEPGGLERHEGQGHQRRDCQDRAGRDEQSGPKHRRSLVGGGMRLRPYRQSTLKPPRS
jgi:hypothetical protein